MKRRLMRAAAAILLLLAVSRPAWPAEGRVLVVFSSADRVALKGGGAHRTGYFLSELAVPVNALKRAGYEMTYASPLGRRPVMDASSDGRGFFASDREYGEARALVASPELETTKPLSSLGGAQLERFDGIFLPGGHAPMADLYKNRQLGRVLRHFHDRGKPTALICHAPVALLCARAGKEWLYGGYRLTAFSNEEEAMAEKSFGGALTYRICDALAEAGGRIVHAEKPWQAKVVWDRELLTGQNPGSAEEFTGQLLEALTARKLAGKPLSGAPAAGAPLVEGELFDFLSAPLCWRGGYATLWIGRRREGCPRESFRDLLAEHARASRAAFEPLGMRGLVVSCTGDYEIAYADWADRDSAARAFASEKGKEIVARGTALMEAVIDREVVRVPPWLAPAIER